MAGLDVAAVTAIYDAVVSHASGTGLFASEVLDHEPLNAPGTGLSCAIMMGPLVPVGRASGLGKTSGRLEFTAQVATPMTQLPAGGVDREMLQAAAVLLAAYSGDFELVTGEIAEGLVRMVDLLGAFGAPLQMAPGWLEFAGTPLRVVRITLPLILNDMWGQSS